MKLPLKILWKYLKLWNRDTINSTLRYMHMGNESICPHKTHTSMFISALFITAKECKLSKCPLADKQNEVYSNNRILSICIKNIVLIYAVTWMNLEDTVISEISQLWTLHSIQFSSFEMSRTKEYIDSESRLWLLRAWGGQRMLTKTYVSSFLWCWKC